jgi:hypothetical protein
MTMSIESRGYQPKKSTLVWAFLAGIVLTLAVGFFALNWRTNGSAEEMAATSADQARAEMASAICVANFMNSPDKDAHLVELKATAPYSQDDLLVTGGWLTLAGMDKPVKGAAELCAKVLAKMETAA